MKALDKVTDNEKEKLSLPRRRVRGNRKLFFLWSAKYEHHGAFGLGLGYSNAA